MILKPDAVQRGLMGRIVSRFEDKGLSIVAMKLMKISGELAERHYGVHKEKPFYEELVKYVTSGPVVAMALTGSRAIEVTRGLMGKTFGFEAVPGTIRGDFGMSKTLNLVHGSDSPESAKFELSLYFDQDELLDYDRSIDAWITKQDEV